MNVILSIVLELFNVGIMLGLTLGALCLLRPVLKRVLAPQQRVVVWMIAWWPAIYLSLRRVALLPVTFQDLVAPRTWGQGFNSPAFLPGDYAGPGRYNLALPGDVVLPVQLRDWMLWALLLLWLAGIIVLDVVSRRKKKALLSRITGEKLDPKDPLLSGTPELREEYTTVQLCEGLPTSFVERSWGTTRVYIQKELPPERLDLVLRHEAKHIKLRHCAWKCMAFAALVISWWNPLAWLGFRYFCQDMELACDSAVMKELPPERRKEYAKTILELGSGRQLWEAPLSFGECDSAVRVKAAAAWKPRRWWIALPTWAAAVLIMLFFLGGHRDSLQPQDIPLAWERETGSAENFVGDLEQAALRLQTPQDEPIEAAEVWVAPEDYPWIELYVRSEDGAWHRMLCSWWGDSASIRAHGLEEVEPPDLSGFTRLV